MEFIIDETFGVPGVGTVVAGTVKQGVIHTNSNLLLGPSVGDGAFKPTSIKSIHYKRLPVSTVGFWREDQRGGGDPGRALLGLPERCFCADGLMAACLDRWWQGRRLPLH